ncbi:hypothetical protein CROQUDRAFT_101058 [Cronartium quercuum f. sp. fusiforme G11]|uniref:Uncharacterized protein n=1 Tax=Cronartium quercuum f. sp. fusiforme G11 TaxID=708437 RepID=A0A9P6N8N5_9BASI|nr:hypothetical protein CROQUDRAFT_101058 [Cronartium quercuum f. sp. fusiforme G11]
MALRTINAKLGDQEVKAVGVAVLKPSGDIKIYTMTHAMAWWLLENKHQWTTIADPRLVTQASQYSVVLHSIPAEVDPTRPEFLELPGQRPTTSNQERRTMVRRPLPAWISLCQDSYSVLQLPRTGPHRGTLQEQTDVH